MLKARDYVRQDDDTSRYGLTLKMLDLSFRLLGRSELRLHAYPVVREHVLKTSRRAFVAVPASGEVTYIWAAGPDNVTMHTVYGREMPGHCAIYISASQAARRLSCLRLDGRFIAYRSAATNLVLGDLNDQPDIFLYDRQTGSNVLLSASASGNTGHRSLTPVFSGDGSTLVFESWASDLRAGDFNRNSDLLACTLLTAVLFPSEHPGEGPWVSWPWVPGRNYRVQYKDSLGDLDWHDLPTSITNAGTKAWSQDPNPEVSSRFYRVISF